MLKIMATLSCVHDKPAAYEQPQWIWHKVSGVESVWTAALYWLSRDLNSS